MMTIRTTHLGEALMKVSSFQVISYYMGNYRR